MNKSFCGHTNSRNAATGFTLIEVVIVVAIIAILAAIAVPSYTRYVVKTRRVAAQACLSQYASYMERFYTTNLRYDQDSSATPAANPLSGATPTLVLDCAGAAQTGNYYAYTLTSLSTSGYTLNATPTGVQATGDSLCGTQTLDQAGTRGPTTSGCWQ